MRIEWAAPSGGIIEAEFGYDVKGFGMDAVSVPEHKRPTLPFPWDLPTMVCWLLDRNDDLGTNPIFSYEVRGPDGVAGKDFWEADHPPFFGVKVTGPERIYRPLSVHFKISGEGVYLVQFGAVTSVAEDQTTVTIEEQYLFPLLVTFQ